MGQMLYGDKTAEYEVPRYVEAALTMLNCELERITELQPFSNSGDRFEDIDTFKVRAYDWNDDDPDPRPNFEWSDFKVWWYKYMGRGMSCNRVPTCQEAARMLDECMDALAKYEASR